MSDDPAPNAEPAEVSLRRRQHAALRRLIEIAETAPRHDREAETERIDADRTAEREYGRIESAARSRYDKRRSDAQAKRDTTVAEADAKRDERLGRLDNESHAAEKSLASQYRRLERKLAKDLQDAEWLAGVTRDADRGRAEQAYEEVDTRVRDSRTVLAKLTDKTSALGTRYGRPLPESVRAESAESLDEEQASAERHAEAIQRMSLPRLFVGTTPWILLALATLAAGLTALALAHRDDGVIDWQALATWPPDWVALGMGAAIGAAIAVAIGLALRALAQRRVAAEGEAFVAAASRAHLAGERLLDQATRAREEGLAAADRTHRTELQSATTEFGPKREKARSDYDAALAQLREKVQTRRQRVSDEHQQEVDAAEAEHRRTTEQIEREEQAELDPARATRDAAIAEAAEKREKAAKTADAAWTEAAGLLESIRNVDGPSVVRFGKLHFDAAAFDSEESRLASLPATDVPALLALPDEANLLLRHGSDGRDEAVSALRQLMLRLLTQLPPGRAQFTLVDPVGLGRTFAGFMHLADYDEALVGGRVLTEADAISARLADLTEHMETVIQKYLRDEFATIDEYNEQAGELAEPYRFLVVADLPTGFGEEQLRRLASIAASGPRCGVHVLVAHDTRRQVPGAASYLEDLARHCDVLDWDPEANRFRWDDPALGRLPLEIDAPVSEADMTDLVHKIGRAAREAKRVEVAFEPITPRNGEMWSRDSAADLHVPVGRSGAKRLQSFRLGRGVAQHALIAGKTGSGKSTLLNGLVTNLALWYAPDQLELYLIDFKRGVEFKAFATHQLPHARAVAVESDREFGLSVLRRLDEELGRRGELFRAAGVQDVAGFRKARPGEPMPRILLVVDEFQELFSDDDKLAQDAALLIDRLVRQGRAFGMHVILGSQTIGGAAGLTRATLGQVAVRVALQSAEADSRLVLGDANAAARLLTRPGEAIYNDAGGTVEANSPFQVAWLPDAEREQYLKRIREKARAEGVETPKTVVFEGNAAAKLSDNTELTAALAGEPERSTVAYLGEAVAIKPPTHATFTRQAGANLLVIGQQEEQTTALVACSLLSLAATCDSPQIVVLDGTPADAPTAGALRRVAEALPGEVDVIDYRAAADAVTDLAAELPSRLDGSAGELRPTFLVIHGLQRFRLFTRDDSFGMPSLPSAGGGFGSILDDDEAAPEPTPAAVPPSKALADLLRDGPPMGMHVIATVDTFASVERRLSRDDLREFDQRALFQMGANDSSALIDSPAANRLGFYRAILASEERGTREKFRPYEMPSPAFIAEAAESLRGGVVT